MAECGKARGAVYPWQAGKSYPTRADAERLVALLAVYGLDFNGCYRPSVQGEAL